MDFKEDFIYRILAGEVSEEEELAFRKRLAEDEAERKEFERIGRIWYRGKYAGKWESINEEKALRRLEIGKTHRIHLKKMLYWNIAAIGLLVLGTGLFALFKARTIRSTPMVEVAEPIHPGQQKALLVLASGEKVELGTIPQRKIAENGVTIQGDSAGLVYHSPVLSTGQVFNELIVPRGGEYRLCLSDGTVVYLNSESRLKYPASFAGERREVELEGEAYFEVAPDKEHPFLVNTNELSVRVLGTGFNVAAYREGNVSEVTLAHGTVVVGESGKEASLKPDEQFVLDRNTGKISIQQVDARKICAWKSGVLYFEGMSLEELAAKLSRWFDVQFFFTAEDLKKLKFTGSLKKYNSIDYALALVEATTNIRMHIKGRTIVVGYK